MHHRPSFIFVVVLPLVNRVRIAADATPPPRCRGDREVVRSGDTRGCPEVSPGGDVFFFDKELAVPPPAPLPTIVDAGNDDFLDKKVLVEPRRAAVDSDEDTDDDDDFFDSDVDAKASLIAAWIGIP